jgi:periplasmic protein TonB
MNQIDEQKNLIEYLDTALTAARKHLASDPDKISRIERELAEARTEFERLSRTAPAIPALPSVLAREISKPATHADFQLTLQIQSEPFYRTFLNNLKSLFVNETKVYNISAQPIHTNLMVEVDPWYRTLGANLKSLVKPEPKSYAITSKPIATDLILEEEPWFKTVFSQLKYIFVREERPDIQVTAQPVEVDEIFKEYKFRSSSLAFSMVVHVVAVLAILFVPAWLVKQIGAKTTTTNVELLDPSQLTLNLPPKAEKSGGGGGGGRREVIPASKGKLPRPSDKQLTPPTPKIVNLDPVLSVEPTVIVPQLNSFPDINIANYGDPLGIPGPPSSGPGTGGGIGTGTGGGVGSGKGGGVGPGEGGGIGGGVFRVGGGVSAPSIVFRVEPTYSEEARKAKYQGVVVLSAIVRKDGTIEILKVVRGLGLGLDENAIQALKQWKFRPGMKNGVAVDVALNIEVNFSLR